MNLLFTGRGGAGSWECRGVQLGAALGAVVKPYASKADVKAADMAIVVKRTPAEVLSAVRAAGRRWAYDIVDAYPQPASAKWSRWQAIQWVREHIASLAPDAVIWPTQKMREDCDTGMPGLVLPHHHRPGIKNNPIRPEVKLVGYEGAPHYLADWEGALHRECLKRGWRFVLNPKHLADLDIVVAVRGGDWDGYVQQNWKSGIKLANAHASGTPFVGAQEAGYIETSTGCEYWAHDKAGLAVCFDWLADQGARELIHDRFTAAAYSVEHAGAQLLSFLEEM